MARSRQTTQSPEPSQVVPPGGEEHEALPNGVDDVEENEFAAPDQEVPASVDDFDSLDKYALPQDLSPGVEEEDPPVIVRRPGPWDYFRVHPDPAMSVNVGIVEDNEARDGAYLITPPMYPIFGRLVSRRRLFVCKTSLMGPNDCFLWAAKLPREDRRGGGGKYVETALKAAERAKIKWTRMQSDEELKAYRIFGPRENFPDPKWPKTTLLELMRKGFGDGYLIKDRNHPKVRRLEGRSG